MKLRHRNLGFRRQLSRLERWRCKTWWNRASCSNCVIHLTALCRLPVAEVYEPIFDTWRAVLTELRHGVEPHLVLDGHAVEDDALAAALKREVNAHLWSVA